MMDSGLMILDMDTVYWKSNKIHFIKGKMEINTMAIGTKEKRRAKAIIIMHQMGKYI